MQTTGIRRLVDSLGRIVLPREIRRSLFIREGDHLEIFTGDKCVILKKVDTRKNVSDIVRDLLDYIDDDGRLSGNTALGKHVKELVAEIEKALDSVEDA